MSFWTLPRGKLSRSADVVVVGSGAGGAFAALTLAEAGLDVVVLEQGHQWGPGRFPAEFNKAAPRLYEERGSRTSIGVPVVTLASGRGLGGSTLVNSAICFRTPESVLDEWSEAAPGAFDDRAEFLDEQDAVWRIMNVQPTPDRLLSGNCMAHKKAAIALGWSEGNIRRNTPGCAGCGRCNTGCPVGGKASVDLAVLPRAVRAGAVIYTGCEVEQVAPGLVAGRIMDRDEAILGTFRIEAKRVVLAAGAVSSARLILNSDIVPKGSPVGDGLQCHIVPSVHAMLPEPVYSPGSTQGHYVDEFAAEDIILESNPTPPMLMLSALPMYGAELVSALARYSNYASCGAMIRNRSRGRVLRSRGNFARIRHPIGEEDRLLLIRAMRVAARLWLEGAHAEWVAPQVHGSRVCRTWDDVMREVHDDLPASQVNLYSSHLMASCPMGSACGPDGQLLEVPGVYCMDSSVLPSNVGRNPQITIMTVARILAKRLAEELGGTVRSLQDPGIGKAELRPLNP